MSTPVKTIQSVGAIMGICGFVLTGMADSGGWALAASVFLMIWGNNMSMHNGD